MVTVAVIYMSECKDVLVLGSVATLHSHNAS